jgi:hypothetical protein
MLNFCNHNLICALKKIKNKGRKINNTQMRQKMNKRRVWKKRALGGWSQDVDNFFQDCTLINAPSKLKHPPGNLSRSLSSMDSS